MTLKLDPYFEANMGDETPVVALDIDGVLNYIAPFNKPQYALDQHIIMGYRIRVRKDIRQVLQPLLDAAERGDVVLAWGTMWEDHARTFANEALGGLGADWPIIYFDTEVQDTVEEEISQEALDARLAYQQEMYLDRWSRVCFKTPAIWDFSRRVKRRVVWFDDMVSRHDRDWLKSRGNQYLFPITVQEHRGLVSGQVIAALEYLVPSSA